MIVIRKSKGQHFIDHFGPNGRTLNHTESFTHKNSAWVNIKSTAKDFGKKSVVIVQDHSFEDPNDPIVYAVHGTGKIVQWPKGVKVRKVKFDKLKLKSKDRQHPLKKKTKK